MEKPREVLISAFSDGKRPTGSEFRFMIESIISRRDDGLDKVSDSPLKVMAGTATAAPVLALCPKDVLDPQWVISLKALNAAGVVTGEGLNIGQGDKPSNPVVYLDKNTGHVGLGTNTPEGALEVFESTNAETGQVLSNPNEGSGAFVIQRLRTHGGEGVLFKNSLNRANDGGGNAMTLRNDAGDLRLQSKLGTSKVLLRQDGAVGINTESPTMPVEINANVGLAGNSLYFPASAGTVNNLGQAGIYWGGMGTGTANTYGIYRTAGNWSVSPQQLKISFDSGIQLAPGTGLGTGSAKSYVEVINGKGLMVSSGNLGVGTTTSPAKAHVVTPAFDGEAALGTAWNAGNVVIGGDANTGALGLGYSNVRSSAYLFSAAPGDGYKDLNIKARTTIFSNGTAETARIQTDGRVGIGTNGPNQQLQVRKDADSLQGAAISNMFAGANAHVVLNMQTDAGNGWLFKNSSTRTADGGANTMTLRNDNGDLRLQATGSVGMQVSATTGYVGIGSAGLAGLSIARSGGKADTPDGAMHISPDTILFGGPNGSTREGNSAQISAGRHQAHSLCIVGMSDETKANRRVDMWAEGGFYVGGKIGINTRTATNALQVNSGNIAITASNNAALQSAAGHTLGQFLFYGHGRNDGNDSARIVCGSKTWDDTGYLAFCTSDDGAASKERVRIMHSGEVGIGTSAPSAELHVSSNGKVKDGNGILLGIMNEPIRTSTTFGEELGSMEIAFAGYRDVEKNQVGAKIAAVRLANFNSTTAAHAIQATELAFFTGDGSTATPGDSVRDTCFERLRITRDGKVGIGTATPAGRLEVVGGAVLVNSGFGNTTARPAVAASRIAGEIAAYSGSGRTMDDGFLRLSAGGGTNAVTKSFIDLSGASTLPEMNNNITFGTAGLERMRIDAAGNLVMGANVADHFVHFKRDLNGAVNKVLHNGSNGSSAYALMGIRTDNSYGFIFKNSSTRTDDGGANTMTMRNDLGDLRMQAQGGNGILLKATSGNVILGSSLADTGSFVEARKDVSGGSLLMMTNTSTGTEAHTGFGLKTSTGYGWVYKNGGSRTSDGGANLMSVVNDNGDLRLMASGRAGLYIQANTGYTVIGLATSAPVINSPLTITTDGIDYSPDGNMRIDRDTILFGGSNNSQRETNSAQISAGKHQADSLCIVGMSDINRANRRVDMWAEGGFNLNGKMKVMNTTPFVFKRFTATVDGPHIYTGFSYNDYIVGVVGFFAYGDRATNGMRALPTAPDSGRTDWKIVCDLHGPNDYYWELVVMAVRREFAEFL